MIVDYRKQNPDFFDELLGLNQSLYRLDKWQDKIAADPILDKILKRTIDDNSRLVMMNRDKCLNIDYYYAILSRFLRNVHDHYANYDVVRFWFFVFLFFGYLYQRTLHGYYDCALDEILPGICSIILDAILLNVNCSARMRHELSEPPNGFYSNWLLK